MTELIWDGKYKDGKKVTPIRIALPFQTIETVNESVQQRQQTLDFLVSEPMTQYGKEWRNRLIWGDKKYVLPSLLPEFAGKVNLIYIDPPFNVGSDFSFTATIADNPETEEDETTQFVKQPNIIEQKAYRDTWGKGLDSYMQWFYETVLLLKELLTEDGSIYVHLDWHIGHYAKAVLDEVFGYENFRNEIVWAYTGPGSPGMKQYNRKHDTIFWYSKGEKWKFNDKVIRIPHNEKTKDNFKKGLVGSGFISDTYDLDEKGKIPESWWEIGIAARYPIDGVKRTGYATEKPWPLLERIIKGSSDENDLVLDCFCGSGISAAVAEKNNRRWITCDLGRFAIHTARKRFLGIENVKPFIVQNLGKYERQQWMNAEFDNTEDRLKQERTYKHFIIELYHAKPLEGYTWLHGAKAGKMIHVGSVEAPVTVEDIKATIKEFWQLVGKRLNHDSLDSKISLSEEKDKTKISLSEEKDKTKKRDNQVIKEIRVQTNGIDFLGWDFAFDVNETAKQFAAENKVNVSFKKIPREVLEKKAVEQGDIKFYELASLKIKVKREKLKVKVELENFIIPPDDVPQEVQGKITHWSQWIDYWAVDWNYKDDTFHNVWQSYRTKQNPKIELTANNIYEIGGKYTVLVKVIDILGNDTTKAIQINV
jgi:DNA modification methylase